jgi:hypothetical protein
VTSPLPAGWLEGYGCEERERGIMAVRLVCVVPLLTGTLLRNDLTIANDGFLAVRILLLPFGLRK